MSLSNKPLFFFSWIVLTVGLSAVGVTLIRWKVDEAISTVELVMCAVEALAVYASLWYILHYKWSR